MIIIQVQPFWKINKYSLSILMPKKAQKETNKEKKLHKKHC